MKKFFLYAFIGALSTNITYAQLDRSIYPVPGPPPEIHIPDAESFTLPNGLKVFVVENHKLPRVNFTLLLDRPPVLEGNKVGMTGLFAEMMMRGTKNRTKAQIDEQLDQIGAQLSTSSSSVRGTALKKYVDQLLDVYSDVLLQPKFTEDELDKVKRQALANLKSSEDKPDEIAAKIANIVNYGVGHPYGEFATEKTIQQVQTSDLMAYYSSYFKPNIAYLAIVGDISKREAEILVRKHFSSWEKGKVLAQNWTATEAPEGTSVILVDRPSSVQSVVTVTYPLDLTESDADVIPAKVLNNILGGGSSGRLFQSLREKRGYTYGAYSTISPDRYRASFEASANVRTAVTDSAARLFLEELKGMRKLRTKELAASKAILAGSFARSLENPATIANFALQTEMLKLPKDYYRNYLKNLDAVTIEQLEQLAPKYMRADNANVIVVGDAAALERKVSVIGAIQRYSPAGNRVD